MIIPVAFLQRVDPEPAGVMVVAAVETGDDIVHFSECAGGEIPLKPGDPGIVAAIIPAAANTTADVMIHVGDIHPGFTIIEIGMDGQAHEATLRPGGDAGSGEVFVAVHVKDHPAPFVTGMDLVDLVIV